MLVFQSTNLNNIMILKITQVQAHMKVNSLIQKIIPYLDQNQ